VSWEKGSRFGKGTLTAIFDYYDPRPWREQEKKAGPKAWKLL
jgi:hypothetical protein